MGATQDSPLAPGAVIAGKYRVERVLGKGAMGAIALCHHDALQQRVAVKVLLPEVLKDEWIRARFVREAQAAAKLTSYHVARVSDVGMDPALGPYIVMEYLEGCDLKQLLDSRGPLPSAEAVDYVLEAIDAIAEAHSHGIVHRDLKPANLFLADRTAGARMVKVLDFGISKTTQGTTPHSATASSQILGSPSYMSPEQVKESKNVDGRADVWSLGIVLYELLTNTVPFQAPSLAELLSSILLDDPRDVRALRPDVPDGLASAVMRCLAKEPDRRFANVAMFARALEPFGTGAKRDCVARACALTPGTFDGALAPATVQSAAPSTPRMQGGVAAAALPAPAPPTAGGPIPLTEAQSTRSAWGGTSSPPMSRSGGLAVAAFLLVCVLGGMGLYVWRGRAPASSLAASPVIAARDSAAPAPSAVAPRHDDVPPPSTDETLPAASASSPSAAVSVQAPSPRPSRPRAAASASAASANPEDLLDRRH